MSTRQHDVTHFDFTLYNSCLRNMLKRCTQRIFSATYDCTIYGNTAKTFHDKAAYIGELLQKIQAPRPYLCF